MNDVFGTPEPKNVPEGEPIPEAPEEQTEGAAPPAADTEKHVPLAALEAERSGRRDWKEKALRYEGELKALRERAQPQQAQEPVDPQTRALLQAEDTRLNTSEMLVRDRYGDAEVDKAFAKFQELAQKDPTLQQRAMSQKHPWDFVVKEAKRAALLEEIGDDPDAYRAKLLASTPAPAPKTPLPTSLAGARSSGARTAPGFSGPPPLDTLFKN